jgi:hypothetical protein
VKIQCQLAIISKLTTTIQVIRLLFRLYKAFFTFYQRAGMHNVILPPTPLSMHHRHISLLEYSGFELDRKAFSPGTDTSVSFQYINKTGELEKSCEE